MSEDSTPKGPVINLKIDKSQQMKDLEQENADLKAKLTIIAEKEFNKIKSEYETEAQKLGINVNIENPNDLKTVRKILDENSPRIGNRDVPLNGRQLGINSPDPRPLNTGLPVNEREYSDYSEMFEDLNKEHSEGNVEASKILHEMTKKSAEDLVKGSEFEFMGKLTKTYDPQEKLKWKKRR